MRYVDALKARFNLFTADGTEDEYCEFDRIKNPKHPRPDICAFIMLHEIVGGEGDMVVSSHHDEFYLNVDCEALHLKATDEQIRDLVRCGVMYTTSEDCLSMFT